MIALHDLISQGGRLIRAAHASHFPDIAYDSRLARPGDLFVALRTARADGHDYIAAAVEAGAAGVLCAVPPAGLEGVTVVQAEEPLALLQHWASARLRHVSPLTVAVAGSVGKTSTCRVLGSLLAQVGPTFRNRQSFNSLLGLPIALARLADEARFAVLECGTDQPGELAALAALFPPQVVILTNVGDGHLDAFGSLAGIAEEQATLLHALPASGWAVLNGDDPHVVGLASATSAQVLTFGLGSGCDLRASEASYSLTGTSFRLHWRGDSALVHVALLGEPALMNSLAAVAAALACGVPFGTAVAGLAGVELVPGRLRPLQTATGATLLDDTFSAELPSLRAALRTLKLLPARRRIVVLGEPLIEDRRTENGVRETLNNAIGQRAGQVADWLVCKGDWGLAATQAARRVNHVLPTAVANTAAETLQALPTDLGPGDLLLVKGSGAARMERVVAGLLAPGQNPQDVLVRQQQAWRSVRLGAPDRPTWLRIDLDGLAHNLRRLRQIAGVPLMAVLKADAYGHGAVRVARTALVNGATMLAVATLSEGRALREADITAPILVLGYTPPWQAREAVALGLTCTVFDRDVAQALAKAATTLRRVASIHVEVDTGMARLGLQPEQTLAFLQMLATLPALKVEGLYTHFATADEADTAFAEAQLGRFSQVLAEVTAAGLRPPLVHAANSAALLRFPTARFDMVRPGVACYGLSPGPATPLPADFRPVLSFHSEVAQVHDHPTGTPISYGGTFVTPRPSRIATIPVGYADGLRRVPPWREVLVRGQRAPIVGRICMDYAMVDVSDIPGVKRGDPVVLIGTQGNAQITTDEVAGWLGTINYEVVTGILARVPREVGD